jgi:hypothetical protein
MTDPTASEDRRAGRPEDRSERAGEAAVTGPTANEDGRAARPQDRSERGGEAA